MQRIQRTLHLLFYFITFKIEMFEYFLSMHLVLNEAFNLWRENLTSTSSFKFKEKTSSLKLLLSCCLFICFKMDDELKKLFWISILRSIVFAISKSILEKAFLTIFSIFHSTSEFLSLIFFSKLCDISIVVLFSFSNPLSKLFNFQIFSA